ncbi:MAG: acyl-CoA reductase [Gemmatimonadota bacterium]|nr:acyl-CoA reductase [Gemmatimonadota bacterium]
MSPSSSFDAWAVPDGVPTLPGTREVTASPDLQVRCPTADPDWMRAVVRSLGEGPAGAGAEDEHAVTARVEALGAVGRRFLDPDDRLRREALALLPPTSGLSEAMAEVVLDGMARDWLPERLARLVREELGERPALGRFVPSGDRAVMAVAPRLCVQLVAGSVPGVAVNALIRSLLLGAPTLLKPGFGDVTLPVLFARALREESPDLARRLAVVYWPGGEEELEDAVLAEAEVVTVYGSDATVASIRSRAPVSARVIGYHHRSGVGVVGSGVLTSPGAAAEAARAVARAVAVFDQRGCVSPRVVYVEDAGADVAPPGFARELARALDGLEAKLPSGALGRLERSAVHQLRGTAEMLAAGWGDEADDRPRVMHGGDAAPWTVFYDPYRALETSCVGRVVVVRPFRTPEELHARLAPVGPHLQTVGVTGLGDRLEAVAEALGRIGVARVAPFETVPFPPPWWHHDGRGPLNDLVRWVDLEGGGVGFDGD